ncbi:MAG: two-component regulator propeller domain-containing protein [Ignavibacterium sp.]
MSDHIIAARIIISVILFTTNFSLAVIQDYKFTQLKIEDGLSQSIIYSIIQDKKGFFWIGIFFFSPRHQV